MGIIAVVDNSVSNGEHGIAILMVEVALGNAIVAGATVHKFPLNIAFASGNQSYNVPQYSNGLASHKSNTLFAMVCTSALRVRYLQLSITKGTITAKWLHDAE
jgi:hypothetical protein